VSRGTLLAQLQAPDLAVRHAERALEAAEREGAEHYLVRCLGLAALVAWLQGDQSGARGSLERAEALLAEVATPTGRVFLHGFDTYLAVARVRLEMGEAERAGDLMKLLRTEAETAGWREAGQRQQVGCLRPAPGGWRSGTRAAIPQRAAWSDRGGRGDRAGHRVESGASGRRARPGPRLGVESGRGRPADRADPFTQGSDRDWAVGSRVPG